MVNEGESRKQKAEGIGVPSLRGTKHHEVAPKVIQNFRTQMTRIE